MKTLIGIPCMDTLPVGFVQSLLYLRKGDDVSVLFKPNSLVYDSRNQISLIAIEENYDRVLWLDSDMMFTADMLQMLHADMDTYGNDMVSGLYFKRRGNHAPVIFSELAEPTTDDGKLVGHVREYVHYPHDTVFPVLGCGFGCVLTSTRLLKAVWDKFGPAFAPYPWAGEDISFCHRVNQLGFSILCDSRISCGHIGTFVYTEDNCKRGDA